MGRAGKVVEAFVGKERFYAAKPELKDVRSTSRIWECFSESTENDGVMTAQTQSCSCLTEKKSLRANPQIFLAA